MNYMINYPKSSNNEIFIAVVNMLRPAVCYGVMIYSN